ncbi:prolipoprotein diacylglyceryl transferase [Bacillus obstructivus]|uniref:prolipoprotein diacylglyceryl transferase n=1 Tax=Heyndrickxia oleronia TaxID=38875 RepID=UPI00090339C6|nr:prolipoprotein diacylglyceryl transferase [Bacillus obstructivus]
MYNELLKIGPVTIYGYGLMIALGIFFAYRLLVHRATNRPFELSHIFSLTVWGLVGGFIGAKLLYWITQFPNIISHPSILLNFGEGFVVYGGIIGGILAGLVYCKMKNIIFLQHLDLFVPSIALAQGFGRIGCLLAGCCYGEETHSFLGMTFHHSDIAPNDVKLIPTQIMESVFSFALCILLLYLAKRTKKPGLVSCIYLILYSTGRFVIEFFRGDIIRGQVGVLSTSQFIALMIMLVTGIFLVMSQKQNRFIGKNV